jgi:hypothetical protein
MGLVHDRQQWVRGTGAPLHVADFVPDTQPLRPGADPFPWAARVAASEQRLAHRVPPRSPQGRRPVSIRVLLAREWLTHARGGAEEDLCHRWRTDCAVLSACGLRAYHAPRSPVHVGLPETRCALRGRIDEARMEERSAIQAAAAREPTFRAEALILVHF